MIVSTGSSRVDLFRTLCNQIAVARCALCRRRLVEQNLTSFHLAHFLVTCTASNVLVAPFERKHRLVVIDQRRLPFASRVTLHAATGASTMCKLQPMNLLMTVLALLGRGLEIYVQQCAFQIRGTMARGAIDRAV